MRFNKILELSAFVIGLPLLLIGCIGSGGGGAGSGGTAYDGVWSVSYSTTINPTPPSGQFVQCNGPQVPMTVTDGKGSTTFYRNCLFYTASGVQSAFPSVTLYYDIGVSITSPTTAGAGDILNAVVAGNNLTGTCVSTRGCSASGLSMIR